VSYPVHFFPYSLSYLGAPSSSCFPPPVPTPVPPRRPTGPTHRTIPRSPRPPYVSSSFFFRFVWALRSFFLLARRRQKEREADINHPTETIRATFASYSFSTSIHYYWAVGAWPAAAAAPTAPPTYIHLEYLRPSLSLRPRPPPPRPSPCVSGRIFVSFCPGRHRCATRLAAHHFFAFS
jgi:hypothetical protein